jgi:hypothetical protein
VKAGNEDSPPLARRLLNRNRIGSAVFQTRNSDRQSGVHGLKLRRR